MDSTKLRLALLLLRKYCACAMTDTAAAQRREDIARLFRSLLRRVHILRLRPPSLLQTTPQRSDRPYFLRFTAQDQILFGKRLAMVLQWHSDHAGSRDATRRAAHTLMLLYLRRARHRDGT